MVRTDRNLQQNSSSQNVDQKYPFHRLTGEWSAIRKKGEEAEKYADLDPSAALIKLRIFAEKLMDKIIHKEDLEMVVAQTDRQVDKLKKLELLGILPDKILEKFHDIRSAGNQAAHRGKGTSKEARMLLWQASYLAKWFVEDYLKMRAKMEEAVAPDPDVRLHWYEDLIFIHWIRDLFDWMKWRLDPVITFLRPFWRLFLYVMLIFFGGGALFYPISMGVDVNSIIILFITVGLLKLLGFRVRTIIILMVILFGFQLFVSPEVR